jgi:hypothetical protein
MNLKYFMFKGFFKNCILNVFVLSHLFCEDNTIWSNIIFPKAFTYEFFFVNLVNVKIDCMFVEYNGGH